MRCAIVFLIAAGLLAGCQSSESASLTEVYKAEWYPLPKVPLDPMRPAEPFDIQLEFLPNNRVILYTHRNKSKPRTETPGDYVEEDSRIKIKFDQGHAAPITLHRAEDGSLTMLMWGDDNYIKRFVPEKKP